MAAAGLLSVVIQREARWRSSAFMDCVRTNLEDSGAVSEALSADAIARGFQPGQGTQWGDGSDRLLLWGKNIENISRSKSQPL